MSNKSQRQINYTTTTLDSVCQTSLIQQYILVVRENIPTVEEQARIRTRIILT
jgi:hypothetical protein